LIRYTATWFFLILTSVRANSQTRKHPACFHLSCTNKELSYGLSDCELLKELVTSRSRGRGRHSLQENTGGPSSCQGNAVGCPSCQAWDRDVSEGGSISNLASIAAVTFNPITQWEKHQKIDIHLKKLQNLFHLHMETNLPQTQIALEPLTMGMNQG